MQRSQSSTSPFQLASPIATVVFRSACCQIASAPATATTTSWWEASRQCCCQTGTGIPSSSFHSIPAVVSLIAYSLVPLECLAIEKNPSLEAVAQIYDSSPQKGLQDCSSMKSLSLPSCRAESLRAGLLSDQLRIPLETGPMHPVAHPTGRCS